MQKNNHVHVEQKASLSEIKETLKKMFSYMKPYVFPIAMSLLCSIISTILFVVGPMAHGKATTAIAHGAQAKFLGTGSIDFDIVLKAVILLGSLYVASAVFSYFEGWIMVGVAQKVSYKLRQDLAEKINRLPVGYFDKSSIGDVLSRVTNDVDAISQTLNETFSQIVSNVTRIIGIIVMMLLTSPSLTFIALLVLPVSAFIISKILKRSQPFFGKRQEYLGIVNGIVEETYGGHEVLQLFNAQASTLESFEKENDILADVTWKAQFFGGIMMPLMTFISNLGYVAVAIFGSFYAIAGAIEVGDIMAFVQYVRRFQQPINQMAQLTTTIQSSIASADRVFDFLEEEEEVEEAKNPASIEHIEGNVTFEHVSFGYFEDEVIIKDFTADIKKGQQIAIVGPTGAGKTTIVKLLMRFYDVNSGSISIDGVDIRDFRRNDLRSAIGMVLQDTWLFNGTIMDNIRYSRLDATDEEVIEAAKSANAHHFINTLPGGYQMEINEDGSNLSQGEKQLLTIARAILADSKILILDEATSSIDTRTEIIIQKALVTLMEERTSFIIAHRLSTIRDSDLVLVINEGDIVEQGTHESLLEANGFYADLYRSQFEDTTAAS